MSAPPVFRSLGARVVDAPILVAEPTDIKEIISIHNNKKYGLEADIKAVYNNPVTEEPIRAKETPTTKEMKVQLIQSIETLTLSPTVTGSPLARLPNLAVGLPDTTVISSPGREILEIPTVGTKISSVREQESAVMVPTAGSIRSASSTVLIKPSVLNIDPNKIGKGRGGVSKLYKNVELQNILKSLGESTSGNKAALVFRLVEYIKNNDSELYSRLPNNVK